MSTIHLNKLLNPGSLALIGASDRTGSQGHAVASSLIKGKFEGPLYFVNPRYKTVLDTPCYKSISKAPEIPDIVIVLVPERIVERSLQDAAKLGVKVAIVMSAVRDSKSLHAFARKLNIRLLGPYCAGIIRPHLQLNASFSTTAVNKGSLAIVTQSASLGAAIVDWADSSGVGFSAVLSTGIDTDITLPDLLDLLAEDHHTDAIIVYLDRVHQPRAFLSAISSAARIKPVVVMKSTHNAARHCDAMTRTGQVFSSEHVMQAALRRAGVVRVRAFSNVFSAAKILTSGIRIKGKHLAIVSNGAAPAMLAYEQCAAKQFVLPQLTNEESSALRKQFGVLVKGGNPFVLRDREALPEQYKKTIEILKASNCFDALLIVFAPDARNDPKAIANVIVECQSKTLPILASFMGESSVQSSRELLTEANIPSFSTPEATCDAADFLKRYWLSQQQLLQLPNPASRFTRADAASAKQLIASALSTGERVLGPQKTRTLLGFFDIDVLPAQRVTSVEDAIKAAAKIGYPVAMKLVSPNILYKASVVGTRLDIKDEHALQHAYNQMVEQTGLLRPDAEFRGVLVEAMYQQSNSRSLAMSIRQDATFGPIISVGIGGDLTPLLLQHAVQLPPLNNFLIEDLLSQPDIATYLGEFRHKPPVDKKGAAHVLRRLSEMACELPELYSLDINPVRVSDNGAVALEVHVVLEKSNTKKRYDHLAIHPYPWQWMKLVQLKHGKSVQLRPIRPEDGESIRNMVSNMSAESRYFRFMHAINELSPQMVAQFTKLDYDRQMAFVAVADSGSGVVAGVSRYAMSNDKQSGEFAVSVADEWQGHGLAKALMKQVIAHAAEQGIKELIGDVLVTNAGMRGLMKSLGFIASKNPEDNEVLVYTLKPVTPEEPDKLENIN